jgi:hypothetical protein
MGFTNNARAYNASGTYPNTVFKYNFPQAVGEAAFGKIVITGKQHSTLRNAHIAPYANIGQVINPNRFSQPAVIANLQPPGVFDPHVGFNNYTCTYFCPE